MNALSVPNRLNNVPRDEEVGNETPMSDSDVDKIVGVGDTSEIEVLSSFNFSISRDIMKDYLQ